MKNNLKSRVGSIAKIGGTMAAISFLTLSQPASLVFAETAIQNGETDFPFNLTLNPTALDVTVTDSVSFGISEADSNDATVSSISIDNELQAVPVIVSNIRATAAEGFTLQPFDSDFRSFAVDSNNFGIAFTGFENTTNETHDLSGAGYDIDQEISADSSLAINFKGLSSAFSQAKTQEDNTQIANIILTIAMKEEQIASMQSFQCSTLGVGEITSLVDEREGGINSYIVGKAKDGNCWMLQDLKLGSSVASGGSIEVAKVNNTNGEVDGSFILSGKVASDTIFDHFENNGLDYINDNSQFTCDESYGCFYNWTAATAGTGLSTLLSGDAPASICPAGWVLPSKSAYDTLINAYGSNPTNMMASSSNNSEGSIPGFTAGGSYGYEGHVSTSYSGNYWTRTASIDGIQPGYGYAYEALINSRQVKTDAYVKYRGVPVRCMAE